MKNKDNLIGRGFARWWEMAARNMRRRGELMRKHGQQGGLRGRDDRQSAQRPRLDRGRGLSGHHHGENVTNERGV